MCRCFASAITGRQRKHSIVLCHGLASNRFTFDLQPDVSVAEYLSEQGWDTWVVELRGSGRSKDTGLTGRHGASSVCFDDHLEDCRAIVATVRTVSGNPVHFVGHSMGAMLLQCMAAEGGGRGNDIRCGVSIAGSLFMGASEWRDYMWLWSVVKYMSKIRAGWMQRFIAPFSFRINSHWDSLFFCVRNVDPNVARNMFRKNWEPLSIALLEQLRSAFLPNGLASRDGTRLYAHGLADIKIPVLLLSGEVDTQCPPSCVEKVASLVAGCTYECMGHESGQLEQYGHFDLIVGLNARREIWDRILRYLEDHDD